MQIIRCPFLLVSSLKEILLFTVRSSVMTEQFYSVFSYQRLKADSPPGKGFLQYHCRRISYSVSYNSGKDRCCLHKKRTNKIKTLGKLAHSGPGALPEIIPIPRGSADWLSSSHSCTLMLGLQSIGRHWVQSRRNGSLGKSGFRSVTKGTQQLVDRKKNKHRYSSHLKLPYIRFISY